MVVDAVVIAIVIAIVKFCEGVFPLGGVKDTQEQ
jgi:hypothetical protein